MEEKITTLEIDYYSDSVVFYPKFYPFDNRGQFDNATERITIYDGGGVEEDE